MTQQDEKQDRGKAKKTLWLRLVLPIVCLSILPLAISQPKSDLFQLRAFLNHAKAPPQGVVLASNAYETSFSKSESQALWVRCRTLSEQIRTYSTEDERRILLRKQQVLLAVIANSIEMSDSDWSTLILETTRGLPQLALAALPYALEQMQAPSSVALLRRLDQRTTPDSLRVWVLHYLWHFQPQETQARVIRIFLNELGRHNSQLETSIVEIVLSPRGDDPLASEALVQCISTLSVPGPTRLKALRALEEHRPKGLVALAESIFLSENSDLSIKHEALLLVLSLQPKRGHHMLMNRVPAMESMPATYRLFRLLRLQEGLPSLPPGPMSPSPLHQNATSTF